MSLLLCQAANHVMLLDVIIHTGIQEGGVKDDDDDDGCVI